MTDGRIRIATGTVWEPRVGYSRAVRVGERVWVTGTTATRPDGGHAAADDAYAQARQSLANVSWALARTGASLDDVVRTRIFVTDIRRDWESIGRAHAESLGHVRPATSMVEVSRLIEEWMRVEIEADAVVGSGRVPLAIDPAAADAEEVAALLQAARLPLPGADDQPVAMRVARADGRVIACAGYEQLEGSVLVRSVAVQDAARGRGIGEAMVRAIVAEAIAAGASDAWLLTRDAAGFFAKQGFTEVPPEQAPGVVRRSRQFGLHACGDATLMRRPLGG